jgi:hypothetical protein
VGAKAISEGGTKALERLRQEDYEFKASLGLKKVPLSSEVNLPWPLQLPMLSLGAGELTQELRRLRKE